jgi:hypothetical protein
MCHSLQDEIGHNKKEHLSPATNFKQYVSICMLPKISRDLQIKFIYKF